MNHKIRFDNLDLMSFMNGLVFFSPVALLVRTAAGVSVSTFFLLQAVLSVTIFVLEIPTGKMTDRIGYKHTLILSQIMLCTARVLLFAAFLLKSMPIFVIEVFVEGIAACFSSGTQSAYIYSTVSEEEFVTKTAHVGNCGTLGFVISTICYVVIYNLFGISGLLLATVITCGIGVMASLGLKKEKRMAPKEDAVILSPKEFFLLICNGKTFLIVVLFSCINIGFILINFFYVDKLQLCGINESFLTPIILGYSIIQLLAEKILNRVDEKKYFKVFVITFFIAGVGMLAFGFTTNVVLIILFMLVLPLLMDLPAYILDGIQNECVDQLNQEEKRAELISIFNMGVNLVEIVFLFASAIVAEAGASICFCILGVGMMLLGLVSYRILRTKRS